jgi:hypothetical protein
MSAVAVIGTRHAALYGRFLGNPDIGQRLPANRDDEYRPWCGLWM